MLRRRSNRGTTLIEVLVASSMGVAMLGGATLLLNSATELSDSAERQSIAATRADRALWPLVDDLRKCSLASAATPDSAAFVDGTTDDGISIAPVLGYRGDVIRGDPIDYRWEVPAGETSGTVVRTVDGRRRILARGVTAFEIVRDRNVFNISLTTVVGPDDDRARTVSASATVSPRNP